MPVILKEKWDSVEQYLEYLRHLAAYALLAEPFVGNKRVLEIGYGSGYGAAYLSKSAPSIVAVDITPESISYWQDKEDKNNLIFVQADGLRLPFKDGSFDVALSFQVIEHIASRNVLNYLSEIRRVIKPGGGVYLVSTPNSRMRLLPFQKPWNPEHQKEYTDEELKKLLSRVFEEVKLYGLNNSDEIKATTGYGRAKKSPFQAYITLPFYRLLGNLLPLPVLNWLRKIKQGSHRSPADDKPVSQDTLRKFSLNDFRVDKTCPRDCLDLYGICRKM